MLKKNVVMVKFIFKLIIAILLFAFCIYVEDYVQRGAGMLVGLGITLIGLFIDDLFNRWEEWHEFLSVTGVLLSLLFFVSIGLGIHFKETSNGSIEVRSPFYTHVLEHGNRMEVKQLNSCYTKYYSKYELKDETYYFVYKGESCSIYNKYGKVLTIPDSFTIRQKDYGHGKLHHLIVNGKTYDMRGTQITYGYNPYVADITPDYSSSPLN